jgi:hypothetical protein
VSEKTGTTGRLQKHKRFYYYGRITPLYSPRRGEIFLHPSVIQLNSMIFAPFRGDGCVSSQRGEAPQIKSPSGDAHLAARGAMLSKLKVPSGDALEANSDSPPSLRSREGPDSYREGVSSWGRKKIPGRQSAIFRGGSLRQE